MKKPLRTLISAVLVAGLFSGTWHMPQAAAEGDDTQALSVSQPDALAQSNQLEKSYTQMLQEWSNVPVIPNAEHIVRPSEDPANQNKAVAKSDSSGYSSDTVHLGKDEQVTIQVEVAQTGLYQIGFDYYVTDDGILPTEGFIQVN